MVSINLDIRSCLDNVWDIKFMFVLNKKRKFLKRTFFLNENPLE